MQHLPKLAAVALIACFAAAPADAQTPLTSERIIDGLSNPTWVGTTGVPGDERIFVLEQNSGQAKIFQEVGGSWVENTNPYLSIGTVAGATFSAGGERGLLGLAFHRDYDENGYVYVAYTDVSGAVQIDRLTAVTPTAQRVNPNSRVPILNLPQPFANHNGGWIGFGPDGYLYIATGDGGAAGDPGCRSQNPQSLLGKMLRIDIDTLDATGSYGIPADNPFVGNTAFRPEIYHLGLRNPWRCAFDPETGDLLIGDVGQNQREEISIAPLGLAGLNFGWRVLEGENCFDGSGCGGLYPGCAFNGYEPAIYTYTHGSGRCSVTGGIVYRGCAIPDLRGTYFFADYCSSQIWSFDPTDVAGTFQQRTGELDPAGPLGIAGITAFGTDAQGEILIADYFGGEIFKVVPQGTAPLACDQLSADWNAISVVSGGVQELALDAGAANAGQLFVVLGSASGTAPGTPFGSVVVPLNLDAYTNFTLVGANQAPFSNSFGVLDAAGRSETELAIPAGVLGGPQVGLTLHHAAVVLDLGANAQFASNPEALTLAP